MNQKKQRDEKPAQPKHYDFNSMILAGKPPSIDNHLITQQDYSSKLKQIKALRKFQDIFRKQYYRQQTNYDQFSINIEPIERKQSPHELTNRLKGMFFLRKKAQLQSKYHEQYQSQQQQQTTIEQIPVQGKTVSPIRLSKLPSTNKKQSQPLNFINKKKISSKLLTHSIPNRPLTQLTLLSSSTSTSYPSSKIFNSSTMYYLILSANKAKFQSQAPHSMPTSTSTSISNSNSLSLSSPISATQYFSYFNVYVEDGNNSEMIKMAVRKRSGWRVVELPSVANMVWSQFYRRGLDFQIRGRRSRDREGNQESQGEKGDVKSKTLTNISLIGEFHSKRRSLQKQKDSPNLLSIEQFNKQIQKICPRSEHMHRKPMTTISIGSNIYFYNHIPNNHFISDKTNLLRNMKRLYDKRNLNIFQVMPFSIDISSALTLEQLQNLLSAYDPVQSYWIVKPGQNSNRGRGITVCKGIESVLSQTNSRFQKSQDAQQSQPFSANSTQPIPCLSPVSPTFPSSPSPPLPSHSNATHTLVLQSYISPLLYQKRKFDLRMYLLVTSINSKIRGYIYNEGYIRTSCKMFSMENFNKFIHLTNDAIQARSSQYGKFQEGNKIGWAKFRKWMETEVKEAKEERDWTWESFVADYKRICRNVLESVRESFGRKHSKHCSEYMISLSKKKKDNQSNKNVQKPDSQVAKKFYFQIFGLDFLIDKNFKTWLIEVNTNPALTTDCSRVVNSLIPRMIDNSLALAVQPFIKNSFGNVTRSDHVKFQNNFEVIYDDQWSY